MQHVTGTIVTFEHEGQTIRFFVDRPEDEIQKYQYAGGFYEAEELEVIRRYYPGETVFADIGANIGNHAIYAEKMLNAPEIVIFEPNPIAIEHLKINLALNNCRRVDLTYLGFPVSAKAGERMTITFSPANNLGNTVFGSSDTGEYRTITGDFALTHRRVGLIKIDTEEMEFQTLAGLEETISIWRPVIFVEVVEARETELQAWCAAHSYKIAESQKRYALLRNYVLTSV